MLALPAPAQRIPHLGWKQGDLRAESASVFFQVLIRALEASNCKFLFKTPLKNRVHQCRWESNKSYNSLLRTSGWGFAIPTAIPSADFDLIFDFIASPLRCHLRHTLFCRTIRKGYSMYFLYTPSDALSLWVILHILKYLCSHSNYIIPLLCSRQGQQWPFPRVQKLKIIRAWFWIAQGIWAISENAVSFGRRGGGWMGEKKRKKRRTPGANRRSSVRARRVQNLVRGLPYRFCLIFSPDIFQSWAKREHFGHIFSPWSNGGNNPCSSITPIVPAPTAGPPRVGSIFVF